MSNVVTLKINDVDVTGRDDETILEVVESNGVFLPRLCHLAGLSDVGACRLCLVELVGSPKLVPACTVKVAEGMQILTETPRLAKYRRMVLELLFTEGNHICSVCVANGHCELQGLAAKLGMNYVSLPYRSPARKVDATHDRFAMDQNRCILCTRCVRVCDEIEGAHTWDVMGRGIDACVITDLHQPWGTAETCTSCGKCVQVCPTGALFEKGRAVSEMTRKRGFLPYLAAMRERKQER